MGIEFMYQTDILLREGYSKTSIAKKLGVSRRTVYNYEHRAVFENTNNQGRPKGSLKLEPFYQDIDSALQEDYMLNAEVLFDRLLKKGYTGKVSILRDYIRRKRRELHNDAVWRFETLPGQQAQVDWMSVGRAFENGTIKKRYAFIMKLGFSRRSYIEFTTSMEQSVLFACMIHGFNHFGGVPAEILFDNMKTAWIYSMENQRWEVNSRMLAFASHYGFTPRRCKVYRPKTKGKVEREVRYVRTSFLPTIIGDISKVPTSRLNELVEAWMERVDLKIIREFGQSRMERFAQERSELQMLPSKSFEYRLAKPLFVSREGTVNFDTNRYSVPAAYRCKQLEGLHDLSNKTLTLRYEGQIIRTLVLKPAGSKEKSFDPIDRQEHFQAWEQGRELEEHIRLQIVEKRKKAKSLTETSDPAVYDRLFAYVKNENVLSEVVI
jgi:transposase